MAVNQTPVKITNEISDQDHSFSKLRANTIGNQNDIFFKSKKDIEKLINVQEKKHFERRHSFSLSKDTNEIKNPGAISMFEEIKKENSLLKESSDIKETSSKDIYSEKSLLENTTIEENNRKSTNQDYDDKDEKINLFSSKSFSSIPKNDTNQQNISGENQVKNLMKDKFIEIDLKYLNNVRTPKIEI